MQKLLLSLVIAVLTGCAVNVDAALFKKKGMSTPGGVTGAPTTKTVSEEKPTPKPAVEPKTTPGPQPVASRDAIVQEVQQEVAKLVLDDMVEGLLRHPVLGANKEDAIGVINAFRKVLANVEEDSRLQALPSKVQFLAQIQKEPKRDLTDREKGFLRDAARHKQTAEVFKTYMQIRPDVIFDQVFYDQLKEEAQKREFTKADEADILKRAKGWTPANYWTEFNNYLRDNHLDWDSKIFGRVVEVIEAQHGVTLPIARQ